MFGAKARPAINTQTYRPTLEPLDDRLAPHGGLGWANFLPIGGFGDFAPPPPPTDTNAVATHFAVFTQRDAFSGSDTQVTVIALDANNRPVKDYTGTVDLASTDGSATLPADYTFTTDDHGRHTFTVKFGTTGDQTVTATDTADKSITGSATVTVDPAQVATHLYVSIERDAFAGSPTRVVVAALDADNRPVSGYIGTVHFTSSDTSATLPADYTFTSADRGVKVFTVTPSAAESLTVTATDTADSNVTGSATSTVNAAQVVTHLALLVRPSVTEGSSTQILVVALDASNHPVAGYTGTVHFTSSDTSATLPADVTFSAADRGVKLLSVTFATAGSETLTVTDSSDSTLTGSANVNVRTPSTGNLFGGQKFHWWS
jgi:cytochrome c oxidase assembly protein Cox11